MQEIIVEVVEMDEGMTQGRYVPKVKIFTGTHNTLHLHHK